jgi:hypothetical protein
MRLLETKPTASPGEQLQPPEQQVQKPEPPPAPLPFLETEPAVMPYVPSIFDIPL